MFTESKIQKYISFPMTHSFKEYVKIVKICMVIFNEYGWLYK